MLIFKLTAQLSNHDYDNYHQGESEAEKLENFNAIKILYEDIGLKLLLKESTIIKFDIHKIAIVGVEYFGIPPLKIAGI